VKSDHSHASSHHQFHDPETIDYESNTYLTIFDNIFRKTTVDMQVREQVRKSLLREMGKETSFAYQKMANLEEKVNQDF